MQRGSLRELLDSVPDFTWDLRLKFAIDAAKGVYVLLFFFINVVVVYLFLFF